MKKYILPKIKKTPIINSEKASTSKKNLIFISLFMIISILVCILVLNSIQVHAIELPTSIGNDGKSLNTESDEPWKIYADELISINDGLILEGKGSVLLVRGNDYLKSDFARLYTNTKWILLQGNVYAKLGDDEVEATEAEFDLNNKSGWVQNAKIFMAGPHLYFSSEQLYKEEGDIYHLDKAVITACDGEKPLWSISASEAVVEADAYAQLKHPVFNVKNQKVIYSPYLIVPTKTTRQSGFLMPEYGYSSTQGVYYTQPWFYNIDQSRDLTLYGTILTNKGFIASMQYRSHTKQNQKLWSALDIMYDQDKVLLDSEDDLDPSDGLIRDNNLRFWLRAMADGDIADSEWKYKYNIDYVSDQNYLREFQNRMTGFDNTIDESSRMFGRDFAEIDQNRVTEGYIYRDFERLSLAGGFRYEQDPSLENGNASINTDDTVQHLPEFYAFWNRGNLMPKFPLELNASFRTGYMYRQEGTSGIRSELYPMLNLPIDLRFASLQIYAGARATFYNNTMEDRNAPNVTNENRDTQTGDSRIIPEYGANLFTQANKVYDFNKDSLALSEENLGESQYTAIRHTITPRLEYSWIDNVDQENNPFYITEDRINNVHDLTLSIDNRFTFKKESIVKSEDDFVQKTSYHDLFAAKFYFGYDFREAGRNNHLESFEKRPIHDMRLNLSTRPYNWLSLTNDTYYSFYDNNITRNDTELSLLHSRYGSFSSSYSWRDSTYNYRELINYDNLNDIIPTTQLNIITNTLNLNLGSQFSFSAMERTNLDDGKSYERVLGLSFLHQCVRLSAEYSKDSVEERVQVQVELLGLNF